MNVARTSLPWSMKKFSSAPPSAPVANGFPSVLSRRRMSVISICCWLRRGILRDYNRRGRCDRSFFKYNFTLAFIHIVQYVGSYFGKGADGRGNGFFRFVVGKGAVLAAKDVEKRREVL